MTVTLFDPRTGKPLTITPSLVQTGLQNAIAVLAVMAAIGMLALTLVAPREGRLFLFETPAGYSETS